jgi:hypothetical protein
VTFISASRLFFALAKRKSVHFFSHLKPDQMQENTPQEGTRAQNQASTEIVFGPATTFLQRITRQEGFDRF